ncbi:MAG: sigma-70 family RNA polymerase sigma factor [Planctomycetota bacterium]
MSTSSEQPTRVLIHRARSGDQDAYASLHGRFAARVRGLVAVRMGHGLADFVAAEDLVQEVLAEAFTGLDRFRSEQADASFVCWLARLVERRVRDQWRARGADKRGGGRVRRMSDLRTTRVRAAEPSAREPSPSHDLRQREVGQELEAALLRLGARARVVVYCRLVLDMDFVAIAAEMGLKNAATARAAFHKAVARLEAWMPRP